MEAVRWMRRLVPVSALALLSAVGLGRPPALIAADPPWQPPPCAVADAAAGARPAAIPWFRLDAVLDRTGTLAGTRLTVGMVGERSRHLDLSPESFASGPVSGRILVGDDDGSTSRLRLLDVAHGCARVVASEPDVIRGAVVSPGDGSIWEHRVARAGRLDLGIWRRTADGRPATRVLPGMPSDDRYGPTFTTELRWTDHGRLGVASCGELACRSRVLDPATGHTSWIEATGPMIGVDGDAVVAYEVCHELPCPILAVDTSTGRRTTLVDEAGAAALGGLDHPVLVFESGHGRIDTLDLRSGARRRVADGAGLLPVRDGSAATSAAGVPAGDLVLAPDGLVGDPAGIRVLDPRTSTVMAAEEVLR